MGLLLNGDGFYYLLGDREFYEPADRRPVTATDFMEPTARTIPAAWVTSRSGVWCYCKPPDSRLPPHGWKIHVSATVADAAPILSVVSHALVRRSVPFKFAADRFLFLCLNRKRWARGGSGKFITAYPKDDDECRSLLESLHDRLTGYRGPYILSDRRYRNSSVLYYRYGAFTMLRRARVDGRLAPVMRFGDTATLPDERRPAFRPPDGIVDPFAEKDRAIGDGFERGTLGGGRYRVERVVTYSNAGGVYLAVDNQTGSRVIIKEARPHTGQSQDGRDAAHNLLKEYRLLVLLEDAGVGPRPIEFFRDWEHSYLVEEYLEGSTLRRYWSTQYLALRTRPTLDDARVFFTAYCDVHSQVALLMQELHERHVVFGDVSAQNVMVLENGKGVRFVDFEGAYECGVDTPPQMFTPGYGSPQVRAGNTATAEDDRFGLGSLLLGGMFPIAELSELDPQAYERFLEAWTSDFDLPPHIADLIRGLLHTDRQQRPTLAAVRETLALPLSLRPPRVRFDHVGEIDLHHVTTQIAAYIESTMTPERSDRLFPASPSVFEGHPASVAFGAAGVAYALSRMSNRLAPAIIDWIVRQPFTVENCAPGLYVGSAGTAWVLLELGFRAEAAKLMALSKEHPLLLEDPDLFCGASGVGLSLLKFFIETQDEMYLARAEEIGEFLLQARVQEGDACWWPKGGHEYSGLAHGGSGVSLFLLYLFLLTDDHRYLDVGRQALRRVLANATRNPDGGLTWRLREGDPTVMPSWRWGSAGVGVVLLRYRAAFADTGHDAALADIDLDTDRKYSIFPGQHLGLAGWGEFYVDWMRFGPNAAVARERLQRIIAGILLFRLQRKGGLAFPGETRTRISCDFASGSAGIGFMIHRCNTRAHPAFMLDELLESRLATAATASLAPGADTAKEPRSPLIPTAP